MNATGLDLSRLSLKQLRRLDENWRKQFEKWGRVDIAVKRAIDEIQAAIKAHPDNRERAEISNETRTRP